MDTLISKITSMFVSKQNQPKRVATLNMSSPQASSVFEFHDGSLELKKLDRRVDEYLSNLEFDKKTVSALGPIDRHLKNRYANIYKNILSGLSKEEYKSKWDAELPNTDALVEKVSKKHELPDDWKSKLFEVDWVFYKAIQESDSQWVAEKFRSMPDLVKTTYMLCDWITKSDKLDVVFLQEVNLDLLNNLLCLLQKKDKLWKFVENDTSAILFRSAKPYEVIHVDADKFNLKNTVVMQTQDVLFISSHLSSSASKYTKEFKELNKFINSYVPRTYNLIMGIDANHDINSYYINPNIIFPNFTHTVNKIRTTLQFQQHKSNVVDQSIKDFLVTSFQLSNTSVTQASGDGLGLLPNANHPFDHYAVVASVNLMTAIEKN